MIYLSARLAELTDELFVATRRGMLCWDFGSGDGVFCARIGEVEVRLRPVTGKDGLPGLSVDLVNSEGRVVQSYSEHDLIDHEPQDDDHRTYWDVLSDLHEMARWSAEGILDLIERMMDGLKPDIPPAPQNAPEAGFLQGLEPDWTDQAPSRRTIGPALR